MNRVINILKKNLFIKKIKEWEFLLSGKLLTIILFCGVFNISHVFSQSTFSSERIKSAVSDLILSKIHNQAEIEFLTNPRTTEFKQNNVQAEIIIPDDLQSGINTIIIKFSDEQRFLKNIEINVRIKQIKKVWVASRNISPNTIISENDLILKENTISNSDQSLEISEIIGKTPSRNIAKDEIINLQMIEKQTLVKRGDNISIVVESGAVRVRCKGTAVQDGSEGQIIRVKRDGMTLILTGKIRNDGSVIISNNNYSMNLD